MTTDINMTTEVTMTTDINMTTEVIKCFVSVVCSVLLLITPFIMFKRLVILFSDYPFYYVQTFSNIVLCSIASLYSSMTTYLLSYLNDRHEAISCCRKITVAIITRSNARLVTRFLHLWSIFNHLVSQLIGSEIYVKRNIIEFSSLLINHIL